MVTQADVKDFQSLYKSKFSVDLGASEARGKLELLVRQMQLVYQPITTQELLRINVNENNNDQALTINSK